MEKEVEGEWPCSQRKHGQKEGFISKAYWGYMKYLTEVPS